MKKIDYAIKNWDQPDVIEAYFLHLLAHVKKVGWYWSNDAHTHHKCRFCMKFTVLSHTEIEHKPDCLAVEMELI